MAEPRNHAMSIFEAGLRAVDPISAVPRHVKLSGHSLEVCKKRDDLARCSAIYTVGAAAAKESSP